MRNIFIILIPILACWSCTEGLAPGQVAESREFFFDSKSFFEQESERLADAKSGLKKRVRLDGKDESQVQENVDWDTELATFRKAGINRPAWTDKYEGDTLYYEAGVPEKFIYQATDEDLLVQRMEVSWDRNGDVDQILIRKQINSLIEQVQQDLKYRPANGYTFAEHSQSRWKPDRDLIIEASFR